MATAGAMRMPIGGPQGRPLASSMFVCLSRTRASVVRDAATLWPGAPPARVWLAWAASLVRTLRPFGVSETLLFFDSVFTGSRVGRDDERSTAPVGQRRVRFYGIAKCRSDAADDSRRN